MFNKQPIVDACYRTNLSQINLNETINKENANDLLCGLYFHSFSRFCEKVQNNSDLKTQTLVPKFNNNAVQICKNIANATIFKNEVNRCLKYCINDINDLDVLPQCAFVDYYVNYTFNTVSNLQKSTVAKSVSNKNVNNLIYNNITATEAYSEKKLTNVTESPNHISLEPHSTIAKLNKTTDQQNQESIKLSQEHVDNSGQIQLAGKSAKVADKLNINTGPAKSLEADKQSKAPNSINTGQSVKQKVVKDQDPTEQAIKPEIENSLNENNGQGKKAANEGEDQNEQTLDGGDDDNDFENREVEGKCLLSNFIKD